MTGKIRFALIGAGRMAKRWVNVLKKYPNVSLVMITDNSSGKAGLLAEQIPNCTATNNLQTVLKNKDIDAVIIATPHKYLSSITSSAFLAGKHVLCEKPGAIKSSDIEKNIALAKKMGLTYMVGYNHRFHDGFIKARKLYEKGVIGKILFIRAKYGFGGRQGYDKEWRLDKSVSGGGHLIDMGVHMIDLAMSFIGEIKDVRGMLSDAFWKKGAEDNVFVMMKGKNKAIASIHTSLTEWKPIHNFEIYGTKGYLSVQGLGPKYGGGEKLILGIPVGFTGEVKEKVIKCNQVADYSLTLELKEFISAIKQNRESSPSPLEAMQTLKIVEKIYKTNRL